MKGKVRRIVVDGHDLRWARSHRHEHSSDGERRCVEALRVWADDATRWHLEIEFRASERCGPTVGTGWGGHEGGVQIDRRHYNLNLPSTIASLIQQALAAGWTPGAEGSHVVMDGVALFDALEA